MADNNFRTQRNRDPLADADPIALGLESDPLAELARLIGQADPVREQRRDVHRQPMQTLGEVSPTAAGSGRAEDVGYSRSTPYLESRSVQPRPSDSGYPLDDDSTDDSSDDFGYSGQTEDLDDAPAHVTEDSYRYRDADEPIRRDQHFPPLAPRSAGADYEADDHWRGNTDDQSYDAEDYPDNAGIPTRPSGVTLALAALGLAGLGVVGAYGYHSVLEGKVLPALPPIIRASDSPNKIIPSHSDSQADAASQAGATAGPSEKLVSREEQPLNIQTPPSTAPRVVSTIPILPGAGAAAQGVPQSPQPLAGPPPLPVPAAAPPATFPAPAPAPAVTPPPPALAAAAPKKIHTVIIRQEQSPGTQAASADGPTPAGSVAHKPATRTVSPSAGAVPLDLVPRQGDTAAPPPPPARVARTEAPSGPLALEPSAAAAPPPRVAREEAPNAPAALRPEASAASPGGGFMVQVSSQRSEEDARAAFGSLRAKFPTELGNRQPIIHRADLGAKGTFYRALVGPFASAEEAAAMCGKLKAAGGACLVQRN